MDDETEDNDDQVDNLNVSFASAVTENIEAPQDSNSVYYSVSSNNISKENKSSTSITKQELLARYFKKLNTGGYYCKLCSGTKNSNKVHKEVHNSDANLRSHLGRRHQLSEFLYPSQRLNFQSKSQLLSADLKKALDDALIYSIVKDSRPFGDFRKAGFQHFLQVILPGTNYKGPHRVTIKKRLVNLYSSYRRKLIEEFSTINHIGLTVDAWTSPSRAHLLRPALQLGRRVAPST
ncbi:unnamed protein product, partial [Rotaria magnacalcarata]